MEVITDYCLTVEQVVARTAAGEGQCVLAAPTVFDQDEEAGLVLVLDGEPPASQSDAVREAVWACPSGALALW